MLVCGIDAHAASFAVCVVDQLGAEVARVRVPNSPAGNTRLLGWLAELTEVPERIGIEGGGNWGLRLAWTLTVNRPGFRRGSVIPRSPGP